MNISLKLRKFTYLKSIRILINGIWKDNPAFGMVLGICIALAITNRVENAIAMGVGVTFVLIATGFIISLLRKAIPSRLRIITYMFTIASFVIIVDTFLKAFFPVISKALGPYVGLIITNCIIMGRAEAFAMKNNVWHSALDGLACGIGYSYTLISIAVIREVLAFGTILGVRVVSAGWTDWVVMAMAPGAFFVFSIYLWITRSIAKLESDEGC